MCNGKPELDRQKIGAVLKRDASKTDYLVLPLAASVLAHLAIATAAAKGETEPDLHNRAAEGRRLLDTTAAGGATAWRTDARLYADVQLYVIESWFLFEAWLPLTYRLSATDAQESINNELHLPLRNRPLMER